MAIKKTVIGNHPPRDGALPDRLCNGAPPDQLADAMADRFHGLARKIIPPGIILSIPDRTVNNLLRSILYPEMASLAGHTIGDHAAISERIFGEPYLEVHQYIDAAVKTLGPQHRSQMHDFATSPGKVAQAFGQVDGTSQEVAAAWLGHYLPDSTTPDGVRFLGVRVHLSDLVDGIMLTALLWQAWDTVLCWRKSCLLREIVLKAQKALTTGQFAQAAHLFGAALIVDQKNARLFLNLGQARQLSGDHAAGQAAYLRAADLFGSTNLQWGDFVMSGKGIALFIAACQEEALAVLLLRRARKVFLTNCRYDRQAPGLRLASSHLYYSKPAVGNAFMAACCDSLLQEG